MQDLENGVVWSGQPSLRVIGNATVRYSAYDFLFNFTEN